MKAIQRIRTAALFAVCAIVAPAAVQAQEAVPAVPYKNVPEITAFIKKQLIADFGDKGITVAKLDLNSPPDGVAEYVIMYDNRGFCGSAGCTTEVARIKPSGEVEILVGILRVSFGLAYTYTNGLRDLLTESRAGKIIWRFDGKEYKPGKGHPRAATTPP